MSMLLNLDDFVRVTQMTGSDIEGRYDGKVYVFPHDQPVDVHKAVAQHIFGFGLPEISDRQEVQDKTSALLRLNWITSSGDRAEGLRKLRTQVIFEEIPPFTPSMRLKAVEENTGETQEDDTESASRVPSSPPLGGGAEPLAASPADPHRTTLRLPKKN